MNFNVLITLKIFQYKYWQIKNTDKDIGMKQQGHTENADIPPL